MSSDLVIQRHMNTASLIELEWQKENPDLVLVEMLSAALVEEWGMNDHNADGMVDESLLLGGQQVDLDD